MTAIITIFGLFVLAFIITIIALITDWRALFQKYYGDDYRHGEAVQVVNGRRTYYHSELWHQGVYSCSYWRAAIINGKKVVFDDIVPNPPAGVPMQYDSNGRRMYWTIPGNAICSNKEDNSYQFTNYPPEMMSADMADRIYTGYGRTVRPQGGSSSSLWVIIGIVVIIIAGAAWFLLKPQPVRTATPAPAATANATQPTSNTTAPGYIQGQPVPVYEGD